MEQTNEIIGYVHNLSPIRTGPTKKYFDFSLQTDSQKSVRGVCFSPQKRKLFADSEENSVPVKIKKFMNDKKEGSTDILMGDFVNLELLTPKDIAFQKKNVVPTDLNLSMLSSISVQQLITLKAKVIGLQDAQIVNTPQSSLKKADGVLVDECGTVKIILWESDIDKVQNGKTYQFNNLRLKKNKFTGELYVNPAKGNSNITECEPFTTTLDIPEDIPIELTTSTINGEIIGVTGVKLDHCCIKCNKPLQPKKIATCDNTRCKLMQKLEKCKRNWYVEALIEKEDNGSIYLIFRHNCVTQAILLNNGEEIPSNLSEENIANIFLSLPKLRIMFNNKTNVVQGITKLT